MFHFVKHSFQDNHVLDCVFFENIDLVQDDICVEQQIVRLLDKLTLRHWIVRKHQVMLLVGTNDTARAATPDISSKIMFTNNLQWNSVILDDLQDELQVSYLQNISPLCFAQENLVSLHCCWFKLISFSSFSFPANFFKHAGLFTFFEFQKTVKFS